MTDSTGATDNGWQPPAGASPSPTPDPSAQPFGAPTPPVPPVPPPGAATPPPPAFPPPAPGFPPPAPGYPYGPPQPQYGPPQPQFGGYAAVPQPGMPGWTPPPKPGLIPLRPLTLGTVLGASFQVLRRNPRPTFGFALLVSGVVFVLTLLVAGGIAFFAFSRMGSAQSEDFETIAAGSTALLIVGGLLTIVLSLALNAVLQGVISLEVARGTLGEKLTLRGLWNGVRGRAWPLIGWTLLVTGAVVAVVLVIVLILGGIGVAGGAAGIGVAVLLGFLLFGGLAVLAVWLGTKLSMVPSALMIERLTLRNAIARSWSLTQFFFWRTFGIILLVAFILNIASSIISTPLQLAVSYGTTLLNPNSLEQGFVIAAIVLYILGIILTLVFGAISSVVQAATVTLLYIDLRMRKEGLELELIRYVEARQAGTIENTNPYIVAPAAPVVPGTSPWS